MKKDAKCEDCVLCRKECGTCTCSLTQEDVTYSRRYCPKSPRETVEFIQKQTEELHQLEKALTEYQQIGELKSTKIKAPYKSFRVDVGKKSIRVTRKGLQYKLRWVDILKLSELAGLFDLETIENELKN